jgi:hypothetical protein
MSRSPDLPVALLFASLLIVPIALAPAAVAQVPPPLPLFAPPPPVLDIKVSDKQGKPIREFLIIAGTPAGRMTSAEFQERTGREATNWQQHTARIGRDGKFIWPLRNSYSRMKLRVEAAGYRPRSSQWIKKDDGGQKFTIELVVDPGSEHRLLQPDGTPAAGAVVAMALPQKDAVLEDGKLRGIDQPPAESPSERWRRPMFIKTDDDGRFRLLPESDPAAAVLVVHDSGVLEMPWTELAAQVELSLRPWGRIEGQVLWHSQVGAHEPIHLSIHRDEYGYPGEIAQRVQTVSDAAGRFVFERVLPGRAQISRPIKPSKPGERHVSTVHFRELMIHPQVKSGEPTPVILGGRGRTVHGRLEILGTLEKVTLSFAPDAPHFGFPGDDAMWDAYGVFRRSAIGPLFFRGPLRPNADGTFEIPHVLPGSYDLRVQVPGIDSYAAFKRVSVEDETPDVDPAALDVGEIKVAPAPGK